MSCVLNYTYERRHRRILPSSCIYSGNYYRSTWVVIRHMSSLLVTVHAGRVLSRRTISFHQPCVHHCRRRWIRSHSSLSPHITMSSGGISVHSPLSVVFLLHVALEIPIVVQGLFFSNTLPFVELNNTVAVVLKLYASLSAATCLVCLLCFRLPEFLPGKRALAIGLCVYHSICSTILYQAPRFIPHTFGPAAENLKITPESVWGTLHGVIGLSMVAWWQATVHLASLARQAGGGKQQ